MMPAATEGGRRRWFAADGCHLAIDVSGSAAEPAVQTLHDARLLGEHDELLGAVARWIGIDPDWAPLERADEAPPLTHTIASRGAQARELGLALDERVLDGLAPPDAKLLEELRVEPHVVPVTIRLERLSLTPEERDRLRPGSLLLLPGSFAESWLGALEYRDGAAEAPHRTASVFVQPGSGLLYFRRWEEDEPRSTSAADGDVACTVLLEAAIEIPLDAWLAAEPADGTCAMTDAFRRPRLRLALDGEELAATLVPLGDGYAALLGEPSWT